MERERRSAPSTSAAAIPRSEAGAINFNATFAIPQLSRPLAHRITIRIPTTADFRFIFNTPGENEQETLDLAIKADWALDFADLVASVPTTTWRSTSCPTARRRLSTVTS
jgi:hypothetical protein